MISADKLANEETDKFNFELYNWYHDALEIFLSVYPVLCIVLVIACTKYLQIARLFYHLEMLYFLAHACIPIRFDHFAITIWVTLILFFHINFYVDVKLNLACSFAV